MEHVLSAGGGGWVRIMEDDVDGCFPGYQRLPNSEESHTARCNFGSQCYYSFEYTMYSTLPRLRLFAIRTVLHYHQHLLAGKRRIGTAVSLLIFGFPFCIMYNQNGSYS